MTEMNLTLTGPDLSTKIPMGREGDILLVDLVGPDPGAKALMAPGCWSTDEYRVSDVLDWERELHPAAGSGGPWEALVHEAEDSNGADTSRQWGALLRSSILSWRQDNRLGAGLRGSIRDGVCVCFLEVQSNAARSEVTDRLVLGIVDRDNYESASMTDTVLVKMMTQVDRAGTRDAFERTRAGKRLLALPSGRQEGRGCSYKGAL